MNNVIGAQQNNQIGTSIEMTMDKETTMRPNASKPSMGIAICLSVLQMLSALPVSAQPNAPQTDLAKVKIQVETNKDPRVMSAQDAKKLLLKKQAGSQDFVGSNDLSKSVNSVAGGSSDGGGDTPCEKYIQDIRNKIRNWIVDGGAQPEHGLILPANLSVQTYTQSMLKYLNVSEENGMQSEATFIECVHRPVEVQDQQKICRFEKLDPKLNMPKIQCYYEAFLDQKTMTEELRTQLIHHEFAGLADIEKPNLAQSDYRVSEQLTDRFEWKQVLMIAIDPVPQRKAGEIILNPKLLRSVNDIKPGVFLRFKGDFRINPGVTQHYSIYMRYNMNQPQSEIDLTDVRDIKLKNGTMSKDYVHCSLTLQTDAIDGNGKITIQSGTELPIVAVDEARFMGAHTIWYFNNPIFKNLACWAHSQDYRNGEYPESTPSGLVLMGTPDVSLVMDRIFMNKVEVVLPRNN